MEATLTNEILNKDMDEERTEILSHFNANTSWNKQVKFRPEDFGDMRDLTPQKLSIEEPPTLDIKPLTPHLKYVYLEDNNNFYVNIFSFLIDVMEAKLLKVLKEHKSEFAWKVVNIKGINP